MAQTEDLDSRIQVSSSDSARTRFLIAFGLFTATLVTYSSVVGHEFVDYDDLVHVVQNPLVTRPLTFSSLLSHFDFREATLTNWLPLWTLSLQLGFALHGPDPAAFLITNVLLHATSAVLLFAALYRLTGALWCSGFVAAVFALHPLQVESVAWVAERKGVLAGFFWMLGLYLYARYVRMPRSALRYLAVLLCMAMGLLSKSVMITFPAVLLLLDVWPLDRWRGALGRIALEKAPMFGLAALSAFATVRTQAVYGNVMPIGRGTRLANAVESYWRYLSDFAVPTQLAAIYPHPYLLQPVAGPAAIAAGAMGIALVGATVLVLLAARKRPHLGVAWLWYLGTLLPTIGLVQVGIQARADRYMYLPLAGLAILLAWGAADLVRPHRRALAAALAVLVLVYFAGLTRLQLEHWKNTTALFERALAVTERNFFAEDRLAHELLAAGRAEEARAHYLTAIAIAPTYAPAYYGLGLAHERLGDRGAAIRAYQTSLRVLPNLAVADGSLGLLLLKEGRFAEARRHLSAAARAMPDSIEYREALGEAKRELARRRSAELR